MLSTILLIIILILFGLYIYKYPPKTASSTKICMDYSNVKMNQLEIKLVRNMINGYRKNQKEHIDKAMQIDDAHSIWFDLEVLKKFIYHTEHNTVKNNVVKNPKLGLRIHYSRYPKYTKDPKDPKDTKYWTYFSDLDVVNTKYERHHTLIAVPTIQTKDGKNVDFNPLDTSTYSNGMPNDYAGTPSTTSGTPLLIPSLGILKTGGSSSNNPTTGAQNHGSLIPPEIAPGGSF